jgi:hypothetical protein
MFFSKWMESLIRSENKKENIWGWNQKKNELKKAKKKKVNSDEPSKLMLISKTQNPLNSIVGLNEEAQYSKNLMLNDEIN